MTGRLELSTQPTRHIPSLLMISVMSSRWITSAPMDLLCFIGAALCGYLVYYMHAGLGWNMLVVWFVWVLLLDGPHFFATYSRTYFDSKEFRKRRFLLLGSLGVFLIAPTAIGLAYGMHAAGSPYYEWPWRVFAIFVSLWAYWHIVRQHYGFMKLYQGKNKDKDPFDQRLDNWVLYGCLLLPFAALLVRHPSSRGRLDLPKHPEAVPDLAVFDGVGGVVGYVQALSWEHWVIFVANFGVAMLVAFFLLRQWARLRSGRLLNVPKLLLLLSVIPLHVYITNASEITTTGLLTFTIIVTIFHDIQYLAIVYFYHRNRYYREGQAQRQYGIAPKFSKNPWVFMTCAVL